MEVENVHKTNRYVLRKVSEIDLLICATVPNNDCWMYELNFVGKLIWDICDNYNSIDILISALDDYFAKPLTEEQKNMVREYLEKLKELGMIQDEE